MEPVVRQDRTGCAIASVAAILGKSYDEVKSVARSIGLFPEDKALWTQTSPVRKLLAQAGAQAGPDELPFTSWEDLPDLALLSIKWKIQGESPAWHWVVFVRNGTSACVLDPKKGLRTNTRRDFGRMRPKWYIPVTVGSSGRKEKTIPPESFLPKD